MQTRKMEREKKDKNTNFGRSRSVQSLKVLEEQMGLTRG